ncbi:GtrA family protein [Halobacillus litoralis]|uniref:GtrA family protein n=1 Tax=Halobacillus litoralis TaxID=45668 RepID=A0A845DMH7_9BACI|nr:GtrA family protein [Halobacillus litoralis]MYL18821.1 GtrA family protein [Halobacillus litoralis]
MRLSVRSNPWQFLKFSAVGGLNTVVDFTVFFLLSSAGLPYMAAQLLSYSCGVANSYVWNSRFTFKAEGGMKAFVKFIGVNLFTLIITTALLIGSVETAGLPVLPAKAAATLGGLFINYGLSRWWVFSSH